MLRILISTIIFLSGANAQILEENFSYGGSDNSDITIVSSWVRHEAGTTNPGPGYTAAGLTYAGYASSGIDGALSFTLSVTSTSNEGDANRTFTGITTGDVYVSFLLQLSAASVTAGGYFVHLGPNPMTNVGSTYKGRVSAVQNGAGFSLALSKHSETAVNNSTVLSFNQTYLYVLKYTFNTVSTTDDVVTLYVYDTGVPSSEPGSPIVTIGPTGAGGNDFTTNLGAVCIRQGSNSPTGKIDGIRVSTSWSSAPLPVELTAFTAVAGVRSAELKWNTATELNNAGFEVQRLADGPSWTKVGFVEGHGTSNSPNEYSFEDKNLSSGIHIYRLKQIDNNGTFKYSATTQVNAGVSAKVLAFLNNFPNPFNPETEIQFSVPEDGYATVKVYNMLGGEVAVLFSGEAKAGFYQTVKFNAANMASGVYFSKLEYHSVGQKNASKILVQRMLLTK